ncbi:MAG: hypothetical protein IH984_07465 [Planctomycetes bacterium]|nr:hypothetical protein [Planctomycetota bacterium]
MIDVLDELKQQTGFDVLDELAQQPSSFDVLDELNRPGLSPSKIDRFFDKPKPVESFLPPGFRMPASTISGRVSQTPIAVSQQFNISDGVTTNRELRAAEITLGRRLGANIERSPVGEIAAGVGRGVLLAGEGIAKAGAMIGLPDVSAIPQGIREVQIPQSTEAEQTGGFAPTKWRWWASHGSEAIGTLLPAVLTGGATGAAGVAAGLSVRASALLAAGTGGAFAGAIEAGLSFEDMRDKLIAQGYEPEEAESIARLGASAYGLAAGIVEVTPMGMILKRVPGGRKALVNVIVSAISEGGEEAVQTVLERTTQVLTGADPTALEFDEDFRTELKASFTLGAGAGGTISAGVNILPSKGELLTDASKFVKAKPDLARKLADIPNTPSRADLKGIVKPSERTTGPERQQIQDAVKKALEAPQKSPSAFDAPKPPDTPIKPTTQPKLNISPKSAIDANFPIADISVDPVRFQFKQGLNVEGVGTALSTVSGFDQNLAGVVAVWRDSADGKVYVINGHHRLSIAKKFGVETLAVRFVEAADAKVARAIGAMINLAEGKGSPIDAAKFFRETGITSEKAEIERLDIKEPLVHKGLLLANLTDGIFDLVVQGEMSIKRGVIIGQLSNSEQAAITEALRKRKNTVSDDVVQEMVRLVGLAPTTTETTASLFGDTSTEVNLFVAKAKLSEAVKKLLRRNKRLFADISNTDKAAALESSEAAIVNLSIAGKEAERAAVAEFVYNKLSGVKGPVSDALNEGVEAIQKGAKQSEIVNDIIIKITDTLQTIKQSGNTISAAPTSPTAEGLFASKEKEVDEGGLPRTRDLLDPGTEFPGVGASKQPDSEISPSGKVRPRVRSAADLVGEDTAKQTERDKPYSLIEDEDIRQRIMAAREGVGKTGFAGKMRDWWQSLTEGTQRGALKFLPRTQQFGQARSDLLKLSKARSLAQDRTFDLLTRTLKPLNAAQYETFSLKVLLDDLSHETGELPYGYTPAQVKVDKARIDAAVSTDKVIQASIEFRKKMWDAVRGDYVQAMESVGYPASERLKKQDYYRHQVLHYLNVKSATKGTAKLRTPTSRGFLKHRKGSQLDINANYLQAEWEVISQLIVDTQTANTIQSIRQRYDILDKLKAQAKAKNFELLVGGKSNVERINVLRNKQARLREVRPLDKDIKAQLAAISEEVNKLDPTMPMRRKIAIGMSTLEKAEVSDVDIEKIAKLADSGKGEVQLGARTVLAGIQERKQLIRKELGDEFVEWESLVPESHIAYAIRPGRTIYLAHSIQESMAQRLLEGTVEELGITADDLREVRGIGSEFRPLVIPNELAQQLDNLAPPPTEGVFATMQASLLRGWKKFRLLGPTSIIKYNLRNASEIEKVFTINPKALQRVPQSVKELYTLFRNPSEASTSVKDWAERGGTKSLIRVQEIGEIDKLKEFDRFLRNKEAGIVKKTVTLPMSAWRGYWRIAGLGTDYRESILRYAAYLDYRDNPNRNHASVPAEVQGIADARDRAYKLANDLLGAYDDVSIVGQELRKRWYPFWSFQETNFRAYSQSLRNIANNEQIAGKVGAVVARKLGITIASKSLWAGVKLGQATILLYGAHALLQAFNLVFFGDEEKELPDHVRGRPHIIFGRNDEGEVIYFSRLGTSGDFLEWFGIDQLSTDITDYFSDRRTVKELSSDVALGPVNKVFQGVSPFVKGPFELATGRSLFPDVTRPRRIQDSWEYVFRVYGLSQEYRAITDKPSKPYLKNRLTSLPAYTIEPNKSAYSEIQSLKRKWNIKQGKSVGFSEGARTDALRNFRLSIRYQDEDSAKRYLVEYITLGGSKEGIKRSLKRMHPLGGLSERDRKLFAASLSKNDLDLLGKAEQYYTEVLLGGG